MRDGRGARDGDRGRERGERGGGKQVVPVNTRYYHHSEDSPVDVCYGLFPGDIQHHWPE